MTATRALAVLMLLLAACGEAAPKAAPRRAVQRQAVQCAVRQLEAPTALPELRLAALRQVRMNLAELAPAILAGIENPESDDFPACANLAAELHMTAAVGPLLEVAMDPTSPYRAEALRAANRIRPLPTEQLLPLLQDADEGLRLRVLRALAGRHDVPFDTLLPLLANADIDAAAAAAAALPQSFTQEQGDELLRVSFGSPSAALAVVHELGRRSLPAELLEHWLWQFDDRDPELQLAALEVVRAQHPKVARDRLLRLVDSDHPLVGFEALRCLVASQQVDAPWLLARTDLPRPHRLICALGLLQLQRPEGSKLLFELAYSDPAAARTDRDGDGDAETPAMPAGETAPRSDPVCILARQVMSRISDLPLHGDPAVFAEWCEHPRIAHREALVFNGPSLPLFEEPRIERADKNAADKEQSDKDEGDKRD